MLYFSMIRFIAVKKNDRSTIVNDDKQFVL